MKKDKATILLLLVMKTILSSCHNQSSDTEMFVNDNTYEVLLSTGEDYIFDGPRGKKLLDIRKQIYDKLPKTKEIYYFDIYNDGILSLTTEDEGEWYVTKDILCYYFPHKEGRPLQILNFSASFSRGAFYLSGDYLFCYSHPELIMIDLAAGIEVRRVELDLIGTPTTLYVDIVEGICFFDYRSYDYMKKMVFFKLDYENSIKDISSFEGNIVFFNDKEAYIIYSDKGGSNIYRYNYKLGSTDKIVFLNKTGRRPEGSLERMVPISDDQNNFILEYKLRDSITIAKLIFPWSDPHINYYYHYYGTLIDNTMKSFKKVDFDNYTEKYIFQITSVRLISNNELIENASIIKLRGE
jgi:hypothetical protein